MSRSLCLLAGAGAEADEPYGLPCGDAFTWNTCYTKNDELYDALDAFYAGRLPKKSRQRNLPLTYQPLFLYAKNNSEFKKLVAAIAREDSQAFKDLLYPSANMSKKKMDKLIKNAESYTLDEKDYETIFDQVITNTGASEASRNLVVRTLRTLPRDSYFGTIETYFSSILNPARRNQQFWKLINYYWSAFFAVAEPLIKKGFEGDKRLEDEGLYSFTLQNLNEVVSEISKPNFFAESQLLGTYYWRLRGHFDSVITTNYTSLSHVLETEPIHVSGALWKFESPESLTVRDITDEALRDDEFVFPYLLTQVPIKPIICDSQVKDLVDMENALAKATDLVVLGYSFCENDAHIASIVGSWVTERDARRLHFFYYDQTEDATSAENVCDFLRIGHDYSGRINTYRSSSIKRVVSSLRD